MSKIIVKSKPEKFRRAGIEFSRAGTELDTDKLSKEQLEQIEAEPNLVVAAEGNPLADAIAAAKKGGKGK